MAMQAMAQMAGPIASGISAIGGLFGRKKNNAAQSARDQYNYNLSLQHDAQAFNERMFRNRLQYIREDAEKAGINPLYGAGLNSASPSSGMNSVGAPDYVGEQNNKVMQKIEAMRAGQDFSARMAEIRNVNQQTRTEEMNTLLRAKEVIAQQLQNLLSRKNLDAFEIKLKKELQVADSQINANIASATASYGEARSARAAADKYNAETAEIKRNLHNRTTNPIIDGFSTGASNGGGWVGGALGATGSALDFLFKPINPDEWKGGSNHINPTRRKINKR